MGTSKLGVYLNLELKQISSKLRIEEELAADWPDYDWRSWDWRQ
jgi:hypothetical protein